MSKRQAIIFLVLLPTIVMLTFDSISSIENLGLVGQIIFRLAISYWYYRVLTKIKTESETTRTQELFVLLFLCVLVTMPIISLFGDPLSYFQIISISIYLIIAAIGLTILTIQFMTVLQKRNIKVDGLTSFIYMAVYPIGIYQYWDLTKK